jgi:3-hydroxybutyryl-CoA dehydratase
VGRMLRKGQNGSFTKVITAEDIRNYADVVGDTNPIHINKEAALAKGFEKQIAHGMLVGSLISTTLGTVFPGEGTIYLEQNLKFLKPVYEGEKITIMVMVEEVLQSEKGIYKLQTNAENETGKKVVEGYAVIKYTNSTEVKI